MHDLAELIALAADEEPSSNKALQARARNISTRFSLLALQVNRPSGVVDHLSARPEGLPEKPIPALWCFGIIAFGLWGMHGAYKALGNGVIWGGKHSYWTAAKYYDRATQPVSFWFAVIVQLAVASASVLIGLTFLRRRP